MSLVRSFLRRPGGLILPAALAFLLLSLAPAAAFAQEGGDVAAHHGGEASLVLPDVGQVQFLGGVSVAPACGYPSLQKGIEPSPPYAK